MKAFRKTIALGALLLMLGGCTAASYTGMEMRVESGGKADVDINSPVGVCDPQEKSE